MNYRKKSILFWMLTIVFTLIVSVFQRVTGPTYPINGEVIIDDKELDYKLLRTYGGDGDAEIKIEAPENVSGEYECKRFKSNDEWTKTEMKREGNFLIASLPHQPPAGKVMYNIILYANNKVFIINEEPVVIRFKGAVPDFVLILHIIFMLFAMILSTRTGLEAIIKGKMTYVYTILTIICLTMGGLILGPIMQKYAFGAYWTGWPFGKDLTDNKTAVAFIFWIIAFFVQLRNKENRKWAFVAAIVLLIIYLIPHSMLGSEIDYTKQ